MFPFLTTSSLSRTQLGSEIPKGEIMIDDLNEDFGDDYNPFDDPFEEEHDPSVKDVDEVDNTYNEYPSLEIEVYADADGKLLKFLNASELLEAIREEPKNQGNLPESILHDGDICELGLYKIIVKKNGEDAKRKLWVVPKANRPQ